MTRSIESHLSAPSSLGKRRRHDDPMDIKFRQASGLHNGVLVSTTPITYAPFTSSPRQMSMALEVLSFPSDTSHFHTDLQHINSHSMTLPDQIPITIRAAASQPVPKSPRLSPPKIRRRILRESSLIASTNVKLEVLESDIKAQAICLSSCHICHKAPKLKTDLDSYGDCWRCHKRVCYICVRICEAQSCGGRKICSSCSVEQGEEGNVSCLDCIQSEDDHIMQDSWSR